MKFKGKPITNASKLPPCMFSDIYNETKDETKDETNDETKDETNDETNDKLGGKRRRKSRKGGSGRGKKSVSFKNTDDIYSMLSGTVKPSTVLNLDNTLSPISISPESFLELGRSSEIQSSVSNKPKSPYTKKSNLKKKGGKRRTQKSNKSKRKTHSKRQRGGGVGCSRPENCPNVEEEEDTNTIDEYLALAIEEEKQHCVKKYLNKGANPNITILDEHEYLPEPESIPAIIYAARHIQPSTILKFLVENLLEKGVNIETTYNGSTPLIEAAEWGNVSAVGYLLDISANINATTGSGVPAIAYATGDEDIPMINLMLDKRKGEIDFNYTGFDTDDENVIDEAEENAENPEIAKILKKYVMEPRISAHSARQRDRVNLGRVLRGVRGTSNRGPGGKLPLDMIRYFERDNSATKPWDSTISYLGGKRKTKKTRKTRRK